MGILPFKQSHAFIIGINNYHHLSKLKTAVNDAEKLAEVLAEEQGFNVHPPLLDASKKDIEHLLNVTMIEKVGQDDRVLLYFAGEGIASDGEDGPEGYIIPADADPFNESGSISMHTLHSAINQLPCNHLLLILDCCFSGSFKWSIRYRDIVWLPKRIFKERFDFFVKNPAWQVITSSAYDQKALDILHEKPIGKRDDGKTLHSPFAEALFKGLQGEADLIPSGRGNGIITVSELYLYIKHQVESRTFEFQIQSPSFFLLEKHDKGEYIFFHPKHRVNLPPVPKRNPYKGLQSYEENDTELFYGREQVIKDLIRKTGECNLIVVTGASGAGKSSVVKAGLIPELRRQNYKILPVIRPGNEPVHTLEKALRDEDLLSGNTPLSQDMDAVPEKLILYKNVLVIDQFEELITRCSTEKKDHLIMMLKLFLDSGGNNNCFKIILTVRADFEPQFLKSELEQYWQNSRYTVPPFTTEELREIIVNPAVQEVLHIEPPKLVDRIIHEVVQSPGVLPLLSFTLSELYRLYIKSGRNDRVLHEDDYKKLGGVIGSLRTSAENILISLDGEHQSSLRKIMLRMITIERGERVGKRLLMEDLDFSENENIRINRIVNRLLEARLILSDKDENNHIYIELVNEALVRAWPTLWEWINSCGEDKIILQNRMGDAVKDYTDGKGQLWEDDPRLELFKNELEAPISWLNRNEKSFVEKSIKRKNQKRNRFVTYLITIIIVLASLLFYAWNKERIAQANYLTSQALLNLKDDPVSAMRYSEKAYYTDKKAYPFEKNENIMQVLSAAAATALEKPFYSVNMQHSQPVNQALFSPSGDRMLTLSSDKTARLWDMDGNSLAVIRHPSVVYSARFSPDGMKILTVSRDKSARLWDMEGNLLRRYTHRSIVTSAVFSPDGQHILTASHDDIAILWDLQGELLKEYRHKKDLKTAGFSPDGSMILTTTNDKAWLWNVDGAFIAEIKGVFHAVFSPEGKRILTLSFQNIVNIWDLQANKLNEFKGDKQVFNLVAFTPDSDKILSAYSDGVVKIWDLNSNNVTEFEYKHNGEITSVAFSKDGTRILTASDDKTAKLWNSEGMLIADFDKHKDRVSCAVFSPDCTKILTASRDNTAKLWDLEDQPAVNLNPDRLSVSSAAFSSKGDRIFIISDKNLRLYDFRGRLITNLEGHTKLINTAVFSPDGTRILTASADRTAKLWDIDGNILKDLDKHTANVNSAVFSPDGTRILTASYDKTVKIWNLKGNLLLDLKNHDYAVNSAIFSPDGYKILTVYYDNRMQLWDQKGNIISRFNENNNELPMNLYLGIPLTALNYEVILLYISSGGNEDELRKLKQFSSVAIGQSLIIANLLSFFRKPSTLNSAIFSPDSSKILTIFDDNSVQLWNLEGELITHFSYDNRFIHPAVFSPDSSKILTASDDNSAQIWDQEGKLLSLLNGHKGAINSAVFSYDGTRILTSSSDTTVKLWDLEGNILLDFNNHKNIVYSAVFSPDSTRILTVCSDNSVIMYYTPEAVVQWLKKSRLKFTNTKTETPISSRVLQYSLFLLLIFFGILIFYVYPFFRLLNIRLLWFPKDITQLPIEQLSQFIHLLRKTQRLRKLLFKSDIQIDRIEEAISLYETKSVDEKMEILTNCIGKKDKCLSSGLIQMNKIQLSHDFMLNINECLLTLTHEALSTAKIFEKLKNIEGINSPCIIISTNTTQRKKLREKSCDLGNWFITPQSRELTEWIISPEPVKAVSRMISSQVNLLWISPYQTKGGVNRDSVFFGRDHILSQILNRNPANYFLVGARQIGKSTILKAIDRRSKKIEGIECFYIVLGGENLLKHIAHRLKLENENIEDIAFHLRELSENRTYLFLIDEADAFVEFEVRTGYKVLNQLRGLSEEGKCYFIMAGFWNLYRYAIFEYQSPIKNFGETLQIGALETDASRKLATVPMKHLNIEFESDMLADKILKETGQRANLIAIVCNELIKNIDLKDRIISEKNIQNAFFEEAVLNALGGWGYMSEDDKANQLDRVIIYAGIGIEPFSQKDIMQALNDNQFPFNPEKIQEALVRLELAFILEQRQMMYSFRIPVFKKMIQKHGPEYMLGMEIQSIL